MSQGAHADDEDRAAAEAAARMVEHDLRRRGINDPPVLEAMARVPRHRFVPEVPVAQAYADSALPTGEGQTISQPYIVARMTQLLCVAPGLRVLEVGAGSGYQAAVLAVLGADVISVERSPALAQRAREALAVILPGLEPVGADRLGRVEIVTGDGTLGHADAAPYDRILVTAGAPALPPAYRRQLADPGLIVIPIGDRQQQQLIIIQQRQGQLVRSRDTGCRFVPLVGEAGWDEQ